jgi:hypothetical protein
MAHPRNPHSTEAGKQGFTAPSVRVVCEKRFVPIRDTSLQNTAKSKIAREINVLRAGFRFQEPCKFAAQPCKLGPINDQLPHHRRVADHHGRH